MADGCNWGSKPREAAVLACNEVVTFLSQRIPSSRTTVDVSSLLLKALMNAHRKITDTRVDRMDEAGTTTVICGVILKVKRSVGSSQDDSLSPSDKKKYVCLVATVGDCKAFVYSPRTNNVFEITSGNRINICDAKDCGGRLGPSGNQGSPDLRNLMVHSVDVCKGDIIFACSDGVHDNLDPQMQGISPHDFGMEFSSWEEAEGANSSLVHAVKTEFMLSSISQLLKYYTHSPSYSPHQITETLVQHAKNITSKMRIFMESNPSQRQPSLPSPPLSSYLLLIIFYFLFYR